MAKARKCDICGTYYDEYNTSSRDTKPNTLFFVRKDRCGNNETIHSFDCCPKCMDRAIYDAEHHKKESE